MMRLLLATLLLSTPLLAQVCDYTVSPASLTIGSVGALGTITVSTQAYCTWTVSNPSISSWFHLDDVQITGSGVVKFTVDANNTAQDRLGTITVAGKSINVTQAAGQCAY